ncbi:homogentisate 1,2-dioxygenase [Geothrix sp. PMB-07]|uniref:homogentisate 1,2-dioxygenase n=1 Tax=Geothrix sp. PMB-07 TaxID=3068640 RepID=UPI0027407423|nr:homogentisate 1,2-dioxygenase [Geothrix sp. PMB-07]WLT32183.1 homogentisate 1,2-dioxygenase [Geothrix sp. PMB-07]
MTFRKGPTTTQAHVDVPVGLYEEEYARNGFFGRTSHLYRSQPPVGWTHIEGDLRPEALKVLELAGLGQGSYWQGRVAFLENQDIVIALTTLTEPMPSYVRNADGDEVHFVHKGAGQLETDFGPLTYEVGDYLVIPRGTVYRYSPSSSTSLLIVEAFSEVSIPDRGMLGRHALFDTDVIKTPSPSPREGGPFTLEIKRLNRITTVTYPFNPINTVGWKGDLTVWQLNIRDIRPVMSERYHLPPSAHSTWIMRDAVICSFLPRSLENGDPGAMKVPFFHSNIDFDEVLFYHDGEFFSRAGIEPGMVTFHAQGIHHGPHPKAIEAAKSKTFTNEKAVMIDTRNPLQLTEAGRSVAMADYWKSWM